MFTSLLEHIKYEVIGILFKVQVRQEEDVLLLTNKCRFQKKMHFEHAAAPALDDFDESQVVAEEENVSEQPLSGRQ